MNLKEFLKILEKKVDRFLVDSWCCFRKLENGALSCAIYQLIVTLMALIIVSYDEIDRKSSSIIIPQRFKPEWRQHVWMGWFIGTFLMITWHLVIIIMTCFYIWYIKGSFPYLVKTRYSVIYVVCLQIYIIFELGISLYEYSWYGVNTCRLVFNCVEFLFWISRHIVTSITLICYLSLRRKILNDLNRPDDWPQGKPENIEMYYPYDAEPSSNADLQQKFLPMQNYDQGYNDVEYEEDIANV